MDSSEAGRRLIDGRFELARPLGSGGMGTVWLARDIALDREVALKEVRPPDPATAAAQPGLVVQLRERAVREARALARLAHPNVVTIHHIVEPEPGSDGHPWIVMELVRGGSLADRLEGGPMPVADVLRLGLDLLSALRAAHAEGVLHRDVKPANVLLRPGGSAVLTDFGIAALHGATGLTSTGALIGSPEYIAPERARGAEGLAASDLWSLGMLLYVAAEGVHPLRRATSLATVVAVLDEPIPAPVRSGPLGPVLERLLVRDLAVRPDAEELEALLRGASSALGGAAPVVPPTALGSFGPATPAAGLGLGPVPATHVQSPTPMPTPFVPGAGNPYASTVPVAFPPPPPVPRRRRRPALLAGLLAVVLTAGVVGLVNWLPDGNAGDGSGKSGDAKSSGTPSVSGPASPAQGTAVVLTPAPTPKASTPKPVTPPKGSLIDPANIRTAIEAFKQQTGTTTFVDMKVYDEYVLADIPTAPGARTVDSWQYRGGVAKRTGPSGTVKPDAPLMDMAVLDWDALPALMAQSTKELGVDNPSFRYLNVSPWMNAPAVRPYLNDEYGQGGYVLAGTDFKVKKVYRS
ncbi:serine/threonine protein kinase [Streptomyces sp. NBC_00335]|uniref:serine/threonine-protein kinase n=1 Tax=unclassified Streptomyces TaxID=2593676 RepID=UPI0022515109|nr:MULTISPECIES: serine/threonine-protein kinase [unclassified Streptomyces]MCX5402900.1 serine/threonine protein kinase [Streptomyces sp. NBC_00086]